MTGPSAKRGGGPSIKKARAALAEARQRAKEASPVEEDVKVFVTRIPGGNLYGWEIRQFGGVVLERGQGAFATPSEAQADGARVMANRFSAPSDRGAP